MARKPRKPIPDAELEVLRALWDGGPATVHDVIDRLGGGRVYNTVQTLLTRLESRGYLRSRKEGRSLVYEADAGRDDLLTQELREVASRVTGGKTTPLVLNLVENSDMTTDDIAQLRRLLDQMEGKKTKRRRG